MLFDRSRAVYVCNLGPVPLFLHPSAIVLLFLAWNWVPSGDWVSMFLLLSVLVLAIILHELGHGTAALVQGARGVTITLWAMGGLCSGQRDHNRPLGEMFILAAGPAVSFALSGLSFWTMHLLATHAPEWLVEQSFGELRPTVLFRFLQISQHLNLWLGIFNSLPIFPLYGGQFLYQLLTLFRLPWRTVHQTCFFLAVVFVALVLAWQIHLRGGELDGGFMYTVILLGFLLYNAHVYLMQR